MKTLKNIYASLVLGFWFPGRNYKTDYLLDNILLNNLRFGIKNINKEDFFYITIDFKNGKTIKAWDTNKYYAWMSRGFYKHGDDNLFVWDKVMPSPWTMFKLFKELKKITL